MIKCTACNEVIKELEKIIKTEDGDVYHEECCEVLMKVYVDGNYVGETSEEALYAWFVLSGSGYEVEEVSE